MQRAGDRGRRAAAARRRTPRRIDIRPGISCSASWISLRPNAASDRSATLKSPSATDAGAVRGGRAGGRGEGAGHITDSCRTDRRRSHQPYACHPDIPTGGPRPDRIHGATVRRPRSAATVGTTSRAGTVRASRRSTHEFREQPCDQRIHSERGGRSEDPPPRSSPRFGTARVRGTPRSPMTLRVYRVTLSSTHVKQIRKFPILAIRTWRSRRHACLRPRARRMPRSRGSSDQRATEATNASPSPLTVTAARVRRGERRRARRDPYAGVPPRSATVTSPRAHRTTRGPVHRQRHRRPAASSVTRCSANSRTGTGQVTTPGATSTRAGSRRRAPRTAAPAAARRRRPASASDRRAARCRWPP